MSGNKILLDTNAVLYLLGGKLTAKALPEGNFVISFINELELLSYPNLTKPEENKIKHLVNSVDVIELNQEIKIQAIRLRKKYKLKLPDAIICATAVYLDASLLTFDNSLSKIKELTFIKPEAFKAT